MGCRLAYLLDHDQLRKIDAEAVFEPFFAHGLYHLKIAREKDIPCGICVSEADEDLVAEGLGAGVISHGTGLSDFIRLDLMGHIDAIALMVSFVLMFWNSFKLCLPFPARNSFFCVVTLL